MIRNSFCLKTDQIKMLSGPSTTASYNQFLKTKMRYGMITLKKDSEKKKTGRKMSSGDHTLTF